MIYKLLVISKPSVAFRNSDLLKMLEVEWGVQMESF